MEIKKLTGDLSVSAQIQPADLRAVADAGFRAVICNRPDGEGADQPGFDAIAVAAAAAGIEARYVPVVTGMVTEEDTAAFARAQAELPGPVLAYCRSGTRSATLWSLSQAGRRSVADILGVTKAAGYDMSGVVS
jgi:sulfide:quinone oxidoreductase